MKICIPSQDGRGLDSEVHGHFGSSPWFTFVDTETGEFEAVSNPSCEHSPRNCHHVGMLSRRGVEVVVSAGIGRRALKGLADAGITVVMAATDRVAAVVEMAKAGELEAFRFDAACAGGFHRGHGRGHHHGHGHGDSSRRD